MNNTYKSYKKFDLLNLPFTDGEKEFISQNDHIYFTNGININSNKHMGHKFRIYSIAWLSQLYSVHIETKWREAYGLPKLCSYKKGR